MRGSVGQGSRTPGGPVLAAAGSGREQGSREDVRFAAKEPSSATLREHRDGNGLQISTPRRHSGRVVVSSVRGSVSVGLGRLVQQIKQVLWAPTAVAGLGDEAYFDANHALHVRKGNVRFYINLDLEISAAEKEKQIKELGNSVAGRL